MGTCEAGHPDCNCDCNLCRVPGLYARYKEQMAAPAHQPDGYHYTRNPAIKEYADVPFTPTGHAEPRRPLRLPRPQMSLSFFLLLAAFVFMTAAWYTESRWRQLREAQLHDIDVLLDRWIDATALTHAERQMAIEELLKGRKSAAWFWRKRDGKFDMRDAE